MAAINDIHAVAIIDAQAFRRMSARASFGAGEQAFPVQAIQHGKPNENGDLTRSATSAYRACVKVLTMARKSAEAQYLTQTLAELEAMRPADVYAVVKRDGMASAQVGTQVFAVGAYGEVCADADVTDGTVVMARENRYTATVLREANAERVAELSMQTTPVAELEAGAPFTDADAAAYELVNA